MFLFIKIAARLFVYAPCLFLFCLHTVSAQQQMPLNLIENGDFEEGNRNFTSDYSYNTIKTLPGEYSITDNASALNNDFKNPVRGDHTYGDGFYLVANADEQAGKKIWRTEVNVLPNAVYRFSLYYCNLYKELPVKTSFAFESGDVKGNDPTVQLYVEEKAVGAPDRDFYHIFRWIHTAVEWYSGTHNGPVTISIENLNTNAEGNDIAIDDIEFVFVKNMPEGYIPPAMRTILSAEYREAMAKAYKPSKRTISFADIRKGDELSPGIFTLEYKKPGVDTILKKKGEKFQLKQVSFNQSESELTEAAKEELNKLAQYMREEKTIRIRVEGHTDNVGDAAKNILLSEERVKNVKIYLMKKGIAEERIETIGFGGSVPIADNLKEETRKLNRRVEFEIIE